MGGLFLCLEGLDGTGKSTQLAMLAQWLTNRGREPILCRDPGHTQTGEKIRDWLLDPDSVISMNCEMLLYMACRAQLVDELIKPALEQGRTVLCDRFLLSTVVYQGYAGGISPDQIQTVGQIATGGILPHWTGVLDLDLESAAKRRGQSADRIEARSAAFQQMVRKGYLREIEKHPDRYSRIDASRSPEAVHQQIVKEVSGVLDSVGRS